MKQIRQDLLKAEAAGCFPLFFCFCDLLEPADTIEIHASQIRM